MDRKDISNMVIQVITETMLGINVEESTHLINDINCDSLDLVEILMAIEDAFDLSVSDEVADKTLVVSDIIDYVDRKISI